MIKRVKEFLGIDDAYDVLVYINALLALALIVVSGIDAINQLM